MIKYRKTKAGQWVAFGPATEVVPGPVTVIKADGSTKAETVASVGRPFDVAGKPHCYGYLAAVRPAGELRATSGEHCEECGRGGALVECVDSSGIGGLCCRRCAASPAYTRSFA